MPKKLILSPLALETLSALLGNISDQNGNLTVSKEGKPSQVALPEAELKIASSNSRELHRIANALERIATSLEKLTFEPPILKPGQNGYSKAVDLPVVLAKPSAQTSPTATQLVQPQSATTSSNEHNVLLDYLKERGINVQEPTKKPDPLYQAKLEKLALFMGQNLMACQELYKLLKHYMIAPRTVFSYSLVGATPDQNKLVRDFCTLLKEADLLEVYTYQGKPDYDIQLKSTGKEQKYLTGAWLEVYVKLEVKRLLQPYAAQSKQLYKALPNLHVVFKDATKAELDLFFAVGKAVFCIETKMRPNLVDLQTYLKKVKPLGLPNQNILIVIADKSAEECLEMTQALNGVQITRLGELEKALKSLINL
jgi:hypothetical protein